VRGVDRSAYNTAASAADLIDLRRALGYASWDVYGASYGARLAQEAMALDGRAIRAVVLASPLARSFSSQAEQPLSTERALEHLFAACGRQATCRDAFPNVEQDFYVAYDALTASPVPVPTVRPDGGRDTVWFDGRRLVDDIRNRMLNRPRMGAARLPLLLTSCAPVTACAPRAKSWERARPPGTWGAARCAISSTVPTTPPPAPLTGGPSIRSTHPRDRHSDVSSTGNARSGFHSCAMDRCLRRCAATFPPSS